MKKQLIFVEPGRIGDWVLSTGCVNAYLKTEGVQPMWIAREQVRNLIVEQFGQQVWGTEIPKRFRVLDIPKFLLKILFLRRTASGVCVISPGRSGRLAMMLFPKKRRFGYVDWRDSGRCLGVDGVWRNYRHAHDHLIKRVALVVCPDIAASVEGPIWNNALVRPSLHLMEQPARRVASLLQKHAAGSFVLFSMSAWVNHRRWTQSGWTNLARRLIEAGYSVVLCGTPGEQEELLRFQRAVGSSRCILLPPLTLSEYVELGRAAKCMITLDSGPMHIAVAVETLCIALYGPSAPDLTVGAADPSMIRVARWDGCSHWPCVTPKKDGGCLRGDVCCMANLSVECVFDAILELEQK